MKSKVYRHGKYQFSAYLKSVGQGWEVGFNHGSTPVFVGNFIHSREATLWYSIMNREIRHFSKKHTVGSRFPLQWFTHFTRNHLYKCYYGYIQRLVVKNGHDHTRALNRDERRYRQLRKTWNRSERTVVFKAA